MSLFEICAWLEKTSVGRMVSESEWQFAVIESVHILALTCLVSTSAMIDFRLLGMGARREPVSQVFRRMLPLAWIGFATALVTGLLMFVSEATKCYASLAFRAKLILLALAGLNALVFHSMVYRGVYTWDQSERTPIGARVAACFSLFFWVCIIFAGRGIAYI